MKPNERDLICPHCHQPLKAFALPDNTGWDQPCQWACFNDDCPYYRDGWAWMQSNYEVRCSYRYRVTGADGAKASPLPVWSKTALKDRIVEHNGQDHGQIPPE